MPVDGPEELQVIIEKILRYERSGGYGPWRRQVNLVAGVGDFGPLIDSMLEGFTKRLLTDGIPASYTTTMTYANWRSPYCPDPRSFRNTTLSRLSEGCLLWVYLGHGQPTALDWLRVPGGAFPILAAEDLAPLPPAVTPPIAVMLACYTGAFDLEEDCLAEEMLHTAGGPVAVLGGSRVTMPYAMAVLGQELMAEFFVEQPETLGEMVLHAKQRMLSDEASKSATRRLLDTLAAVFSSSRELVAAERVEHAALFNLLGDPLLRIHHPQQIVLESVDTVTAGQTLEIAGNMPIDGRCTLELICRRDGCIVPQEARAEFETTDAFLQSFNTVYAQANEQRWHMETFEVQAGPFRTQLPVPADAHGPCHVRLFIEGAAGHALGAADVTITSPPAADAAQRG